DLGEVADQKSWTSLRVRRSTSNSGAGATAELVNAIVDAGSSSVRIQKDNWRRDASGRHSNQSDIGRGVVFTGSGRQGFYSRSQEERDETREQSALLCTRNFCFIGRRHGTSTEGRERSQESVTIGGNGRARRWSNRSIHNLR